MKVVKVKGADALPFIADWWTEDYAISSEV